MGKKKTNDTLIVFLNKRGNISISIVFNIKEAILNLNRMMKWDSVRTK